MTLSLVIDTATSRCAVALIQDKKILWQGHHDGATSHGSALPALVAQGLEHESQSVEKIEEVLVGMGPGPFTGLRIGIVFAQTFSTARKIPLRGFSSLDAIAKGLSEVDEFILATDARRKEIYWATYRAGKRVSGPNVGSPALLEGSDLPIFGEGAVKYRLTTSELAQFPDLLGMVLLSADPSQEVFEPLYLRRPDAVPTLERKLL